MKLGSMKAQKHKPAPVVTRPKITQMVVQDTSLIVLRDDGTLWKLRRGADMIGAAGWHEIEVPD